jgi:hypothetical protein
MWLLELEVTVPVKISPDFLLFDSVLSSVVTHHIVLSFHPVCLFIPADLQQINTDNIAREPVGHARRQRKR